MKRLLQTLGLTFVLALPAAASAQGGGYWHQPRQGVNAPIHQQYNRGIARGRVERVNVPTGFVLVRSRNQGTLVLRGMPGQLAGINAGDRVRLPYQSFDGALWLSLDVGGGRASFGRYGRHVRTRGRINRLDRRAGVIVIKDQTYRVHPAYLEQLSRGDRVHAEYVSVAGRNWVTSIRPNARVNEGFNQGRAGHGRYHP